MKVEAESVARGLTVSNDELSKDFKLLDTQLSGSCLIPNLEVTQLRANPDLEVVPLGRLTHSQLEMVASVTDLTQIFGVFRSRSKGCVVSAIDHDTAILFSTLSGSGQLTEFLCRRLGSDRDRILARLVYDGVLQVRSPDGHYLDGSAAHHQLCKPRIPSQALTTPHPILRMSRDAVAHCALINYVDTLALSQRLYLYNCHPQTREWKARLPDRNSLQRWLGLQQRRSWRSAMRSCYVQQRTDSQTDPWLRWRLRSVPSIAHARYKIYVSPHPSVLPEVFQTITAICCQLSITAFKVGGDVHGILRPDKLILYLTDKDAVLPVARALCTALGDVASQGVPFTTPVDSNGLVSYGVDLSARTTADRRQGLSWRQFIAGKLAKSIKEARSLQTDALIDFAFHRLRVEGIDPDTWQANEGW